MKFSLLTARLLVENVADRTGKQTQGLFRIFRVISGASGAPWVSKYGNPSMREAFCYGYDVTIRTAAPPDQLIRMAQQAKDRA